ncbi:helix-turn-helix domain-containing protein [Nocardia sp. NPDC046763]|uniref:TetR/AcrR family transcriptional regulator n=1 Tax=Nocardia sp. NPDC046763 TaxID=3155256 RepID=UPI00340843CA
MSARERILDAAADIMRERGVARATTKEIARAAGYSEAALYKHFRDKEDVIVQVLRERMPAASTPSVRPGGETVAENLFTIARAAATFYQQALPLFGGLLAEHARLVAHRESMARYGAGPGHAILGISEYLRAEQELGRVDRAADVEIAAVLLDGACFHQAFLRYYAEGPDAGPLPDDTVRRIAQSLTRAL